MLKVSLNGMDWDTLSIQAAMLRSVLSDAPRLPTRAKVRRIAMPAPSIGMAAELIDRLVGSLGNSELHTTAIDPVSTSWALGPDAPSPHPRIMMRTY